CARPSRRTRTGMPRLPWSWHVVRVRVADEGDHRGVAVVEHLVADRADFAGREEPRQRDTGPWVDLPARLGGPGAVGGGVEGVADRGGVVPARAEQTLAPAVAREDQRPRGPAVQ